MKKSWKERFDKLEHAEIHKSWLYLLYIYLVLPALLLLLAYLSQKKTFALLFHNYGLFVANPIPGGSLSGWVGLILGIFFTANALRKKDWKDSALCLVLLAADAAYFLLGVNYMLLQLLPSIG
ncbi:MAG: hypothetical protein RR022_00930 [Angelakisella sp.]